MDKEVDYPAIGAEIGRLVAEKQEAYGDSFGKSGEVLAILYPQGVKPGQYRNLLATARVIDKLFRIANQEGAFREDPWKDVAGYALLAVSKNREDRRRVLSIYGPLVQRNIADAIAGKLVKRSLTPMKKVKKKIGKK